MVRLYVMNESSLVAFVGSTVSALRWKHQDLRGIENLAQLD